MAIKGLALIEERDRRNKKKKEKETVQLKSPEKKETTTVKKTVNNKGTTYTNKSTISTKPTVQNTTQNRTVTNKDRLTSQSSFGGINTDIRTVKTQNKPKQVYTADIYERDGNYYYKDGKKEKQIDRAFVEDALKNKKSGVIGRYDSKGTLRTTDEKGNVKKQSLGKKAGYLGRTAGVHAEKGTVAIADAAMQEAQNDLKKGENLKTTGQKIAQLAKAISNANPQIGMRSAIQEAIKNSGKIWKDKDKNTLQKYVGTILEGSEAVGTGQLKGVKDMATLAGSLDNSLDEKVAKAQEKLDAPVNKQLEKLEQEKYNYGKGMRTAAEIVGTTANMAPGIATSVITRNPELGLLPMMASAKGQATERALQQGTDLDTAVKMGTTSGLIEGATEQVSGGLNVFGKGSIDDIIEGKINSSIRNKGINFLAKQGFGLTGEVGEELISDLAGVLIDKGTIDPNAKYTWEEFLNTVKNTIGSTALTNLLTGGYGGGAYRQNIADMQDFQTKQAQRAEVIEQVNNGTIDKSDANQKFEQIENGTYEQNKNLDQIATQQRDAIDQAVQTGQLSRAEATQEMEALDKTLTSERERINTPQNQDQTQSTTKESDTFNLEENSKRYEDLSKSNKVEYFKKDNGDVRVYMIDSNNNLVNEIDLKNQDDAVKELGEKLGNQIFNTAIDNNQNIELGNDINNLGTETDYFMTHRPTETSITADNLTNQDNEVSMPEDIYEHPEYYFDMSKDYTKESVDILRQIRNNPNAEITIYRATTGDKINKGDWVTLSKKYAEMHNESQLDGKGNVVEMKVKPTDIQFAGDEINEFGYFPKESSNLNEKAFKDIKNKTEADIRKDVNTIIDDIQKGTMPKGNQVIFKESPKNLQELGLSNQPMLMSPNEMRKAVLSKEEAIKLGYPTGKNDDYHQLGKKGFNDVLDNIYDPVMVIKENDNKIIVFTEQFNYKKQQVIVPIEINTDSEYNTIKVDDVNVIKASYGKSSINNYLNNLINKGSNIIYKNTKKIQSLNDSGKVQYPDAISSDKNTIQQNEQNVNSGPEILDTMPVEKTTTIKSLKKGINKFRQEVTDAFAPIYDLAYKKTKNKNLYYKADRILSSDGRAQVDLDANQVDLNGKPYKNFTDEQGNKVAMGFETAYDMYNKIPNKAKNEFLVHQLNIDRWNQGVDQFGIPIQESEQKIEELRNQYEKIDDWSGNIYQYYRNLQQKMVDNGRIPQSLADEWQKNTPHYVHIQRQVNNQGNTGVSVKNGKVDSDNLIRKVKGGDYAILPIKETTAKFTQNASRAFAFNDFGKEYARAIGTDARGGNVSADTDIDEIFGFEPEFVNSDGKGTYTMKIYEKGVPVEIPISEDVYNSLSPKTIPRVGVLAEVTNVYKDLLTNKNPFFGFLRNPIKDAGDMFLYSKHPLHKSIATYTKLFGGRTALRNKVITKDGVTAQDIVDFYRNTGNSVHSIFKNGQFESNKNGVKKSVDKVLSPIEKGNDFMESMPRITEFWNTIQKEDYTLKDGELVPQKGKNPKKTPEQVIAEASFYAADVTVNFKRGGRTSKAISQNGGIFFNPSVQGASKFVRNVTEAVGDAKSGDFQAAKRLVARAAMLGVAPAILSAVMYGDDDEYKEIQDYQKDQYYLIKNNDGKWIRIPKGRAISLVESAARRTMDTAKGDKDAFKGYGQLVKNQIAPSNPLDNNILSPLMAAATNKSWSGNKIVSDSMAKRDKAEQFNEKTDEFSKWIGKQLNISPMKVNYVIDQYSGVLGDLILPQITPKATTGSSNPVMNILRDNYSFDAANSNKNVGEFYDEKRKANAKTYSAKVTEEDKLKSQFMNTKAKEMYDLYSKKQEIQMDKNLSNKEKYKQALEVQKEINKFAKEANNESKDIKVGKNSATVGNTQYYKKSNGDWAEESEETAEKRKDLGLSAKDYYYYKNEESYTTPDGYTKTIVGGKNAKRNMAIVDAFNFDPSDYLEYTYELSQIKEGKNTKKAVKKYIQGLPISAKQKSYLFKTKYKSYRSQDNTLANEINKSNLSKEEKEEIYSYLGLGR